MGIFRTFTAAALGAALVNWLAQERAGDERSSDGASQDDRGSGSNGFRLASREIEAGGTIDARFEYDGFDCAGANESPALDWSGAPEGTRSFALTLYDPDAPTGSGWWHWVVIDIPVHASGLNANAGAVDGKLLPEGARQLRNDFGQVGYGGVCPPRGDRAHRYVFTLHALKVAKLDIPDDASAALAGFMIHGNSLGSARFSARYGRPRS